MHECTQVVARHRLLVNEEQWVTRSSSLPKRCVNKVRSYVSSFLGMNNDEHFLSSSRVQRFERFADEATKFVRDVEGGCTLRHYNFFSPLTRLLLEGKRLKFFMLEENFELYACIQPISLEGRGVEAMIYLDTEDRRMPLKQACLLLVLRLSESTDIVRTVISCLQSLEPHFMSMAKDAVRQLAVLQPPTLDDHIPKQDDFIRLLSPRPDPLCCREKRHGPCTDNTISSRLPYDFPEFIVGMLCRISAAEYTSYFPDSKDIVSDWPTLHMTVYIFPHKVGSPKADWVSGESPGAIDKMYDSPHEMPEMAELAPKAMDHFIRQPEQESYLKLYSPHGSVSIKLEKPRIEKVQSKANNRSRPRRVANRRCRH